jgi:hypothetical protein
MNGGAALAQLRAVGDLLGQRVLEGVQRLGIELLLVDELARDQGRKCLLEFCGLQVKNPCQDRLGELLADHCRRLQHSLRAR